MISRSLKDKSIKMRERLHDWMDLNRMGQEGDMFHATDPRVRELLQRTAGVLKPGAGQEEAMAFAEALRTVERALTTDCRCVRFGEGNPHWPCPMHTIPAPGE